MIIFLLISGIISLIFGILFLVAPTRFWERIGNFFNKPVLFVESKLRAYNFAAGFIFLILGTWLIFIALEDSQVWFLYLIGAAFVIFGLLYIFTPNWLAWISNLSGRVIIAFDQVAIASRTSLGVVLILAAVYIFFKLFVALR